MTKPKHITLDIGNDLLKLADLLVEAKNVEALNTLSDILPQLILADIVDTHLSIIEIQDYINDAILALESGIDPVEIKRLTIRKLIEDKQ